MIPLGVLASTHVASGGSLPAADGVFSFIESVASSAGSITEHTLSGMSLGDECTDRTIIVVAVAQASVSSITVAGETVTIDADDPGLYSTRAIVGHVTVEAATTGDVVVTLGGAQSRLVVGLWRYGGAVSVADTDTVTPIALSVQSGDMCVIGRYWSGGTYSWSGATHRFQTQFSTSDYGVGADHEATSTATTNIATTGTAFAFAGAAYRPA